MAKNAFVIAAGGTGAKVVESLVHLCAAGLGPEELDVLILDVDQDNGNVERAKETVELYEQLNQWDWSIRPQDANRTAIRQAQMRFFHTRLTLHLCLEPIAMVGRGGLAVHLGAEEGSYQLLDLLYTESEQTSTCKKGFLARPNLGCLVFGGHLKRMLETPETGAATFKARLANALDGVAEANPVPLVVIGSIFGGTGASLFPVVCGRLETALGQNAEAPAWKKVAPVAVMLAPYFLPNQATGKVANAPEGTVQAGQAREGPIEGEQSEAETVDPSRYNADTANTLDHYTRTTALDGFRAAYLIGSDQPEQNRLRFVEGANDQANPPFIEEVVAALAVLDANTGKRKEKRFLFETPPAQAIAWAHLPFKEDGVFRLALFLELAAFTLQLANAGRPLSGGLLDACRNWSNEFELLPWFGKLLDPWAKQYFGDAYEAGGSGGKWARLNDEKVLPNGASASKARASLTEYTYRLLLWARTALPPADPYRLVEMGREMDYASVWELMCGVSASEIEPAARASGEKDNALVRLARAASVAMAKIAAGHAGTRGLVLSTSEALPGFPGRAEGSVPLSLPLSQHGMKDLAESSGLDARVHEKFTKTEIEAR